MVPKDEKGVGIQSKNVSSKTATCVHVLDVNVIRNLRVMEFLINLLFEGVKERFVHSTAQEQRPSTSHECLSGTLLDREAAPRESYVP